jgi:hypothetical protein
VTKCAEQALRLDLDLECDIIFGCCSERGLNKPKGQREMGKSAAREGPEGKEVSSGGGTGRHHCCNSRCRHLTRPCGVLSRVRGSDHGKCVLSRL